MMCASCPQETYLYAKTLLDCATANADGRARALVVGGGIANFTDVAATFRGIIQVNLPADLTRALFAMFALTHGHISSSQIAISSNSGQTRSSIEERG